MAIVRLRHMKAHERGRVSKIRGGGEIGRRLRDMGVVPGTEVEVKGRAPLYDPVHIKVRGADLTLRNNEADIIEVEVDREL